MRNLKHRFAWTLAILALVAGPVAAGSHEEGGAAAMQMPTPTPVELYGCHFNDGMSMDDLMQVVAKWNAWMDENERKEYGAAVLVPIFHSPDIDFDVVWAGFWPNGAAMGESMKYWVSEGSEYKQAFDEVVDCPAHAAFAALTLASVAPSEGSRAVQFSNCTIKEGREFPEAMAAAQQWIAHEKEQGLEISHHFAFPVYGEASDADYDFKWVSGSDYEHFGNAFDDMAGGSWQKSMELFGDLLDCDSSRVYNSMYVRTLAMEE